MEEAFDHTLIVRNEAPLCTALRVTLSHLIPLIRCRDMLSLSLCSHDIFELLKHAISRSYVFIHHLQYIYYQPKKLKQVLTFDTLPPNPSHITLVSFFNSSLNNLPNSVTHLTTGDSFNQSVDCLPTSIKHLKFGAKFNQPVNKLPPNLTHLTFGASFDQPVDSLPHHLTDLHFGTDFSQKIDNLPSTCKQLILGGIFAHPIENLPPQLTHLTLSAHFNHPLNHLPATLVFLCIPSLGAFHHQIRNLPQTLTHLLLGTYIPVDIDSFPPHLTHLKLSTKCVQPIPKLPDSLVSLTIQKGSPITNTPFIMPPLPSQLTTLKIKYKITENNSIIIPTSVTCFKYRKSKPANFCSGRVSSTLKQLSCFQLPTIHLPNLTSLTIKSISTAFIQVFDDLPTSLHTLRIFSRDSFSHPTDHLPCSLTSLTLNTSDFNHPIDNLPPSLTYLDIKSDNFNQPLDNLPSFLKRLTIHSPDFNHPVDHLPPSLNFLYIGAESFSHHVDIFHLFYTILLFKLGCVLLWTTSPLTSLLLAFLVVLTSPSIISHNISSFYTFVAISSNLWTLPSSLYFLFFPDVCYSLPLLHLPLNLNVFWYNKSMVTSAVPSQLCLKY